jgi:hypothetical protein
MKFWVSGNPSVVPMDLVAVDELVFSAVQLKCTQVSLIGDCATLLCERIREETAVFDIFPPMAIRARSESYA